jgi:virulence factor
MLKIGIIGLGDIAQKAYLPVISKKKVAIHLHTRNDETLAQLGEQYRVHNLHRSLESLIDSGIQGAFVHTATASHQPIVEQLLAHNIPVYVDKPITYDYASTEKLVALARKKDLLLTVGFNRRYAPAYQQLKAMQDPSMIILQKNRAALPGDIRKFIYDDFIHVLDTLLFLFPHPVDKVMVTGKKKDSLLYHVVVQLVSAQGATAIGIMNRDSGTVEEKLEVFTSAEKRAVYNVTDTFIQQNKNELKAGLNDWESTLYKRGFEQIIDDFLQALQSGPSFKLSTPNMLETHRLCEQVVAELSGL